VDDEALIVRASSGGDVELADRRAGAADPLLPLAWVLWLAVGVQEQGSAQGASSSLGFEPGEKQHADARPGQVSDFPVSCCQPDCRDARNPCAGR
jgi:hypothetical protein